MAFPKIDGYVVTEKLGTGSYSTVYKAYTKVGARMTVAIKCVDKARIKNSGSAVDNLITEIRLLKTLTHPHIVHMHNFSWDDRNIYIIMEYCCGGDLSKYIKRYGRVPETQVLYFLQQLASALKFLREKGVVHMDLKPHNLLLHKDSAEKYILKVADFGFAQHMSAEWKMSVRGSPLYMAPEMLAGDYGPSVDLWSVGVIMYECLFGRAPYSSNTFKELVQKIRSQAPIQIPPNSSISPGCADLLTRLLQHEPAKRITYEEFFKHEYLDLEHMPSKENYEKAIALIKEAIDLDSRGSFGSALAAYTCSLRLLVPCALAERDAVRRAAINDKLNKYMDRAEYIKNFLKDPTQTKMPMRFVSKTGKENGQSTSDTGRKPSLQDRTKNLADVNLDPGQVKMDPEEVNPSELKSQDSLETEESDPAQAQASEHSPAVPNVRSRFALKNLFGRQSSLPFLDTKDSSIANEDVKDQKMTSEKDDTCRIT